MQQLLNNVLKDALSVTLTTTGGNWLTVRSPIELGTEALACKSSEGDRNDTIVVPFHAIQRIHVA